VDRSSKERLSQLTATIVASTVPSLLGGLVGAGLVVGFTQLLKESLALVSNQAVWLIITLPLLGLALSVLALYGFGRGEGKKGESNAKYSRWRTFPPRVARSDLTGEMVAFAGEEEGLRFRLAPLRAVAIAATVGLGGPLGTEAPAAYLGVAIGGALGTLVRRGQRFLRCAAVAGGAAGVSALMGIPLVGTAYMLELGRRHDAPLDAERVTAGLGGGGLGWLGNLTFHVNLIRRVVPKEPPHTLTQALLTALLIGALAGAITALTGAAIYRAKAWHAHPAFRLVVGGLALTATTLILGRIAGPEAAVGPGTGTILWVENTPTNSMTVLVVALLRALATTSAAAAGGCGGLFVPFLAVGDLGGRVFAHGFGVPDDLAGSAGAASGIAGGYHLPITAVVLVIGQGGSHIAALCCLATVVVATIAGTGVAAMLDRWTHVGQAYIAKRAHEH
jgi:H+/Cl- antiporter ClcA